LLFILKPYSISVSSSSLIILYSSKFNDNCHIGFISIGVVSIIFSFNSKNSFGNIFNLTSIILEIVNCCKNLNSSTKFVLPLPFSPYMAMNLFVSFLVLFKLNDIFFNDLKFLALTYVNIYKYLLFLSFYISLHYFLYKVNVF